MNFLKNFTKDKTIGFYLAFGAALIVLITSIIFVISVSQDVTFSWITFVFILLGAACQIFAAFKAWTFLSVLSVIFYGIAVGQHFYLALETYADIWTGVNFFGGNAAAATAFGIIFVLCAFATIASCFMKQRK